MPALLFPSGRLAWVSFCRVLRLYGVALPISLCAVSLAHAAGVSGYLPLNLAPEIERQVERVLVLGDQPVLVRPVPIATVVRALPKACRFDAALCRRVRAYLAQYDSTAAVTDASGELAAHKHSTMTLPNQHGLRADATWRVDAQAFFRPSDYLQVDAGIVAQRGDTKPTGSQLSVGTEAAQLDVGYRDRWLSPLSDSSMLQSTEAPTLPSVTLSNSRPLTRLGFEYQFFLARMSYADRIVWRNGYTAGSPRLAGLHLGIEPVEGWAVSGNGTFQFGGGARAGSLSQLARSLFQRTVFCTTTSATTGPTDCRFSNRTISITSAYTFPGRTPFGAYVEYAGRDTFHGQIYRFHETGLSAGLHFPNLAQRFDLTLEASEWQNGWYTDYVWLEGMTEDGYVTGHWGADGRVFSNAAGASSAMAQLGWSLNSGDLLNLRYRTLQNASYSGLDYRRAQMATLEYSQSRGAFTRGLTLDAGRDVYGASFARLAAFLRFDGDDEGGEGYGADADDEDADGEAGHASAFQGTERFVDIGASTGRLGLDRYGFDTAPAGVARISYTHVSSPHVGLGVRRAVSTHNDFGVRVEFDNFHGAMIALRALDYRYRLGAHAAVGAFAGFARYSAPTPAQGYYAGLSAQWRDLWPRWDLSLDWRYFDRLQRDKLLPGESTGADPVESYTMNATTLSLSRRF